MKVLSLFSGGGLGDYGLELAGMETVGQCEKDEYCQKILKLRWPEVPKWEDIHDVTGEEVRRKCGAIDVVAGGFPCQPFSVAGQQRGTEDDRHLWPQMLRVIREVQPTWVIAENVPGIVRIALDDVLASLEAEGYETITIVFPAHALGAPHKRDRVWIVGYAEHFRRHGSEVSEGVTARGDREQKRQEQTSQPPRPGCEYEAVADTRQQPTRSIQGSRETQRTPLHPARFSRQWEVEPRVGRVADGSPNRVDRLKLLGNGQVVQAAQWIGEHIMALEQEKE